MELSSGSLVRLKSGGPLMTLRHINQNDEMAYTTWFSSNGELKEGHFSPHQLEPAPPPK